MRAFSLVEVLIAIVVLALGLLGLAAVFPAVVTQQRAATDAVMSTSIENSITDYLRGNGVFNRASNGALSDYESGTAVVKFGSQRGWQMLTGSYVSNTNIWSKPFAPSATTPIFSGDWQPINPDLTNPGIGLDPLTGDMRVAGVDNGAVTDSSGNHDETFFTIPISQRLYPTPYASAAQPLYVWDFIARRVPAGITPTDTADDLPYRFALQDDSVQLAIFVRRIDTGIRKSGNYQLADVLTGTNLNDPADRRVPVAEQPVNNRPTFDGLGNPTGTPATHYSGIHFVEFELFDPSSATNPLRGHTLPDPGSYIRIDPDGTAAVLAPYARQTGQKLVDSFGVVHTVTPFPNRDIHGAVDGDPNNATSPQGQVLYEITPPIDKAGYDNWTQNSGGPRPRLGFTTQVPATVFVVTIPTATPGSN